MKHNTFHYIRFYNTQKWKLLKNLSNINRKIDCVKYNIKTCKDIIRYNKLRNKALLTIENEIEFYEDKLESFQHRTQITLRNIDTMDICINRYTSQY